MYRLWKTLLNYILLLGSDAPADLQNGLLESTPATKSILIIGGGNAGLGSLKTFLDVPARIRRDWDIVLYEKRDEIGGIWAPDPNPPQPPMLPETPLHPSLRTNAPVPLMTFPRYPFSPGTPLFPKHDYILAYLKDYASRFHLSSNIYLNHTVLSTSWVGNSSDGHWNVTTLRTTDGYLFHKRFDHILVAGGHNHYPYSPTWEGLEGWLANTPLGSPKRDILHSIYYRDPERWRGRTVVVIGGSGSSGDVAFGIAPLSRKVYHSVGEDPLLPPRPPEIRKPKTSHFTNTSVVFVDGTSVSDVDSVILGTGFERRFPFLSDGSALTVDPMARSPLNSSGEPGHLITNLRYVRPLYKQLVSLSSSFPPTALYILGLPNLSTSGNLNIAQTIFVINTILDPSLLPRRSESLAELRQSEQDLRSGGYDPDYVGHKLVTDRTWGCDYQDGIVEWLRERRAPYIPLPPKQVYNDRWRRDVLGFENIACMRNGWARIEKLGAEEIHKWVGDIESEEDWAEMMRKLIEWEKEKHGNGTCGAL